MEENGDATRGAIHVLKSLGATDDANLSRAEVVDPIIRQTPKHSPGTSCAREIVASLQLSMRYVQRCFTIQSQLTMIGIVFFEYCLL